MLLSPHTCNWIINKNPKSQIPTKLKKVPRWRATSLFSIFFFIDSRAHTNLARLGIFSWVTFSNKIWVKWRRRRRAAGVSREFYEIPDPQLFVCTIFFIFLHQNFWFFLHQNLCFFYTIFFYTKNFAFFYTNFFTPNFEI